MGKNEQELLDQLGRDNHERSPEIQVYENLRHAFDGLDDSGRRAAALRSIKHWKGLTSEKQHDNVRLISGLWRYHLSANDITRSERVARLILRLGRSTKRPALEAEGLLGMATALMVKGLLAEAIQTFELSRALFAARKTNRHDAIRVNLTLAEAYRRYGDRSSALAILQRTRHDCLETEDVLFLGSASQGLGLLSLEGGDLVSAIQHFLFVRQSSELLGSKRRSLRAMLGLAISYSRAGDLDKAGEAAQTALREAVSAQLPRETIIAHEYLGEVAARRLDWSAAMRHYSLVNKYAITPAAADVRIELHRRLVELWLYKGNMRYALLHVRKGLGLDADDEDRMALRRLELDIEWRVERDPTVIDKLTSLATEVRKHGLGYEYLLLARLVSKVALEAGREDLSLEWWKKASSMAVLNGTEDLLEVWKKERELELERSRNISDQSTSSKLWQELPKIDLGKFGIVTRSQAMIEQGALIAKVAPTGIPVLLTGESGTGKELFASLVHCLSTRNTGPLLAVNCAAMPSELIESELFGHRRGSFTGATGDKDGLFRAAHRGTIFLDEIGEMPTAAQSKLLRVLETGKVRRVGDTTSQTVDVRIVAATNIDLEDAVRKGSFRRDLFYRLRGLVIHLTPLRQRLSDIPVLADHFVEVVNEDRNTRISLPYETKQWLLGHQWPGNVRELKLSIERAAAIAPPSGALQPHHFVHSEISTERGSLTEELEEIEKARVRNALEATGWNVTSAANLLGLTRTTLSSRLKRLGIERPKD
jgi:DNA-binding NtrC family response regulator